MSTVRRPDVPAWRPGAAVGWRPLLAAGLLALTGCASLVGPGVEVREPAPPAAWIGAGTDPAAAATDLASWWRRFDDPVLVSLVEQSQQANASVQAAQAALRQARAQRGVAQAALLPGVGSSASVQRSRSGGNSGNNFRAGLDATWELDLFGINRSGIDAAQASAGASAASLGAVQVSVAAEVALGYIALRNAQARLAIAGANLASQLDTLQITQWRVQAGLATSLESEQARAGAEQTNAQLPALQTQIAQSRNALAVLTGRPPTELAALLEPVAPVPQAPADIALGFPADTLRQRPDVRAAEWQVAAALARVTQADARRLPSFTIGGSLGLSALTLGALTNGASLASALLASVSLPVFDGGALRSQVQAQQAALEQAQAAYRGAVLVALQEVEDALVALRSDRDRLASLRNAADAAANSALLARQRYSSGLVDFQIVLDTQRTLLGAQDSVANAVAGVSADHVRLYKALGGGWQADTAAAAAAPAPAGPTLLPPS